MTAPRDTLTDEQPPRRPRYDRAGARRAARLDIREALNEREG